MSRRKFLLRILLHIFISAAILSVSSFSFGVSKEELLTKLGIQPMRDEKKTPSFCLEDLAGKKIDIKSYKGKVIFLNFWATWCGPCKEEMPGMEAVYQEFKEKDFIFLTVSVDYEGVKRVKEFIERYHYTFPVLLDPKCEVLDLYKVKSIPTTFVIDKKGNLVGKAVGPRNWKSPEITSLLNLLAEKKN